MRHAALRKWKVKSLQVYKGAVKAQRTTHNAHPPRRTQRLMLHALRLTPYASPLTPYASRLTPYA